MAAESIVSPSAQQEDKLRPLNLRRDLKAVADLVELSFADMLDEDGRRYIRQMRHQARRASHNRMNFSISGVVWEEHGRIVGNLNLIPIFALRQRAYLIANVAVHPDFQGQGIASAMTAAALENIKKRGARSAWLQVNAQNPNAIQLYKKFGFVERARRTTWHSSQHGAPKIEMPENVSMAKRQAKDWPLQRTWLRQIYPGEVNWHLPVNLNLMRPGLSGAISRMFNEKQLRQWSARLDGELVGTVSWQASSLQADWLWLAAAPGHEDLSIRGLLLHARKKLNRRRILAVNYPADRGVAAFNQAGFHQHQTLIWMHTKIR